MIKVRILGLGMIISGVLLGYFFSRTDVHLLSGILIGLGVGWTITGRFITGKSVEKDKVRSE
ncbi:MAG: hypothetical protein KJO51_01115 [Gramella sp.]|nr:hypothetical protein [Christiangramia sp.]